MRRTIWKYSPKITDHQTIDMPAGSEIISVAIQNDMPVLYAIVNPDEPLREGKKIMITGTGHSRHTKDMTRFIGTFLIVDDSFVGHVFEII